MRYKLHRKGVYVRLTYRRCCLRDEAPVAALIADEISLMVCSEHVVGNSSE